MPWTSHFQVHHSTPRTVSVLDSSNGKDTVGAVNAAFSELINICIEQNLFHILDGKHSEPFAIPGRIYYGVHQPPRGRDEALDRPSRGSFYTSPGMLDGTVAGGIKAGSSPLETIIHEEDEEASLPEKLGLIIPDIIYVHDLELPSDVVPKPNDDEVETFYSMTVEEVQKGLLNGEFKPDSAAVLIDFFIRHGVITADNGKDFIELSMRLHRRLPFRTP
ncbi:hypothetical protein GL218_00836 [Daldinia childiae]|uniref:uncharacterized protein n=1 Tax=Daldinia childiae TaxID=326645 RepID=UPI00144846EC|nr:uncharacterized protein GL218_00836 [Daldinia childiae]KAF3070371.1 hypothetical protein GL218_00836 [Daldinia childiae]